MNEKFDKTKGMFAGLFVGDALGAPHEFTSSKNIYTGKIYLPLVSKNGQRYGIRNKIFPIGTVTDDSEMSLVLANSLIDEGKYIKKMIVHQYIEWAHTTSMIGRNTRFLFKERLSYQSWFNRIKQVDENVQGNGSLMRCSPLAVFENYEEIGIEDCDLTNPNDVNRQCSILYLTAVRCALMNFEKRLIFESVYDRANKFDYIEPSIVDVLKDIKEATLEIKNKLYTGNGRDKGWVVHSFYGALVGLKLYDTTDDLYRWIIEENSKSDTDTVAAIAGALFGAYYGFNFLNHHNFKSNYDRVLNPTITGVDISPNQDITYRPEKYLPNNVDQIVECLIATSAEL